MQINNLAIVFGPTLMYAPESQNMATDLMQQNLVIEAFLVDYESIFQQQWLSEILTLLYCLLLQTKSLEHYKNYYLLKVEEKYYFYSNTKEQQNDTNISLSQ